MGQGVSTKMLQVAARIFSIRPERVKIHSTNTFRISNTSPSAASATSDLNGKAVEMACHAIWERLKPVAAELAGCDEDDISIKEERVRVRGEITEITWNQLILTAYNQRVSLSEHAHYATPQIHFDYKTEKGHPFSYHVYGTAVTIVTVDCIRGTYEIDDVKIVHDFGESMNPVIDLGQVEGGVVQGIGWMTMEEILYDREGRLRSNALSTYKVPDIYSAPKRLDVHPLKSQKDNMAIFRSKTTGEPPLMYGIGTFFALRNAVRSFNKEVFPEFSAPFTPEKVLMNLYGCREDAAPAPPVKTSS
jgi:xanthine dehydrogenase large subunit